METHRSSEPDARNAAFTNERINRGPPKIEEDGDILNAQERLVEIEPLRLAHTVPRA